MSEISCAIERVDVPAVLGPSLLSAALFGNDVVLGERGSQALNDESLGSTVGLRDEIMLALELKSDVFCREIPNHRTRLASNGLRGVSKLAGQITRPPKDT
jgi:hypothetical protein